ncbi:ZIP zinc transporter-domain-containing protein [Pelagophyceae sp. CCMP2097]|nr:ZIP zinc transporter-domain-containing protein [Pelagophyceae sp. CCMP2097]|mmetsp:Transcript_16724/g.56502  ORF Transcript_16724/g.56502 Transcript_16724/m.56502 type:complete len:343 (-) Transcript_16724:184-1212(-)
MLPALATAKMTKHGLAFAGRSALSLGRAAASSRYGSTALHGAKTEMFSTAVGMLRGGATLPVDLGAGGSLKPIKVGLALLLCAFNAACWGIPLCMKQFSESPRTLGIASTFSGGVFLALAFGHMIPEAAESFAVSKSAGDATSLACMFTLAGYLLIWGVDRIVASAPSLSAAPAPPVPGAPPSALRPPKGSASILLAALSVHSILETMALAVARTKATAVLLAVSIALHQPAESVALLVSLLRSGFRGPQLWRLLLSFTAMGPVGALAGLALHQRFSGNGALDGALIALTAGTFVYVGASEVIPEEFGESGNVDGKAKVAALLAGVAMIVGLAKFAAGLEAH